MLTPLFIIYFYFIFIIYVIIFFVYNYREIWLPWKKHLYGSQRVDTE
jgi:high-affinity Fe2+/Pb2+ permease